MGKESQDMTLQEAQQLVDNWISQFEEGYWSPLSNLARLIEEDGELSRELNHRYGEKPKKPEEQDRDLALEMGDILWVIICLANSLGIDLTHALRETLAKVTERDFNRYRRKTAEAEGES